MITSRILQHYPIAKGEEVEIYLLRIEKEQLRWFEHVAHMSLNKMSKQVMMKKLIEKGTWKRLRIK